MVCLPFISVSAVVEMVHEKNWVLISQSRLNKMPNGGMVLAESVPGGTVPGGTLAQQEAFG